MKFNRKNFPRRPNFPLMEPSGTATYEKLKIMLAWEIKVEEHNKGFEAELRERQTKNAVRGFYAMIKIKEILGE